MEGTLIGASEGTQVKAVAPGQVVYADWLDGFWHAAGHRPRQGLHEPLRPQISRCCARWDKRWNRVSPWPWSATAGGQERPASTSRSAIGARAINPTNGWPDAKPALAVPDRSPLPHPSPSPRGGREQRQQHRVVYHFT